MNPKRFSLFILMIIASLTVSACTNKAWYDGVKEGARNNCRSQPPGEVDACMEKLNTKTYEEYEKERSGQK